jgi:Leucine-rich repeat (LRR) protein
MDEYLLVIFLVATASNLALSQKLLVCHVTGNTCTFREKVVNKDEEVVIVADHGGSTTNADIKEVKFEVSSIYSIPPELFTTFKNLEVLRMIGQELEEIRTGTFQDAHNLRYLDLASNSIRKIDEDTFNGAYKLTHLLLKPNAITEVHKNAFKKLTELLYLDLSRNSITFFDRDSLENLPKLQVFGIHDNQLTSLHKTTFKNNPNLVDIWLANSRISALSNTMFSHLKNLNILHLANTHCINKIYEKNASSRIAEIENDLRNCGITYLGLENDEIIEKLNQLLMCKNC